MTIEDKVTTSSNTKKRNNAKGDNVMACHSVMPTTMFSIIVMCTKTCHIRMNSIREINYLVCELRYCKS